MSARIRISRYRQILGIATSQDPFSDALNLLGFLCSKEYLTELLVHRHRLPLKDAKHRIKTISPHVRLAMSYINQSLDGPAKVSFLPAYYAILNLMKVYILLGPRHYDLRHHRWHGASYDVHAKDSRTVLTEVITIKPGGAIPLFYESITGQALTSRNLKLNMKFIFPYVSGVEVEYYLATKRHARIAMLRPSVEEKAGKLYPKLTASTLFGTLA